MAISKNNLIRSKRINGEWMDMALNLAKKGKGKVPGRPLVGCVIVDKNNKKIGDGFFSKIGGHHAEIKALKRAGIKAKGATMYVTLEPHCFQGRGIEELKGAGIKVEIGLKKKEANKLNQKWLLKNKN